MKLKKIAYTLTLASVLATPVVLACTGLRLTAEDGGSVIGRTMEFGFDVESNAIVVPVGTKITSSLKDKSQGIQYTSKYGMVGANVLAMNVIVDGINDQGLYVGSFYFPGYAGYAKPDEKLASQSMAPEDYGAWILANFSSVAEVKANYDKVRLIPNPIKELDGESFPGHFVVHDKTGASVVIEPIDGKLKIYDNPLGVFTNSPTFDWHMTNLRNYINLTSNNVSPVEASGVKLAQLGQGSGMRGLPGDFTPPSRFVRAFAFSQTAQQLPTASETVPQVFHIMNNFDIPVGSVRDNSGDVTHYDYTVWTTASDLKNLRWAFRTYEDQSIRSIDLNKALAAANGKVQVIKMASKQPIDDVTLNFSKP
ncbi:choloylglycine hydrolase family protein [Plesiomonas shigelloides]|uniref:choloylglycine hydrolase family protein n=1 Tax=Plesiomonas shigelloides TaxID=703 RepID=UPI001261E85E|nr:choloylglycine hydrolase family protein [Plesiomonas shigelloides]KAB7697571.1 linear amide C-N hydrolase [Plesiomonas shigelloides]